VTPPDEDWPGLTSRARGFVVGFCLGDALASRTEGEEGPLAASDLSRAFLNETLSMHGTVVR